MSTLHPRAHRRTFTAGLLALGLAAAGVVAFPISASAATFTVTTTVDDVTLPGSIRYEIAAANAAAGADTITFAIPTASPVIKLLATITITDGLTVDGSGNPGLLFTGGAAGPFDLFQITSASPSQSYEFSNVIFDGAAAVAVGGWQGHAIYTNTSATEPDAVNLTSVVARNLAAPEGPVLDIYALAVGGTSTITDSTFTANTSQAGPGNGGGALYFRGVTSDINISGSTFTSNTAAKNGGAIYIDGNSGGTPTLSIDSSTFSTNKANGVSPNGLGGAVYSSFLADLFIDSSNFVGNESGLNGGAVAIDGFQQAPAPAIDISRSSFLGNKTKVAGGGLWFGSNTAQMGVDASTFAGNILTGAAVDAPLGNSIALTGVGSSTNTRIASSTFDEPTSPFATWAITVEDLTAGSLAISHSTIVGAGAVGIGTLGNSTGTIDHTILWSIVDPIQAVAVNVPGLPGVNTIAIDWSLSSGAQEFFLAPGAGNHFSVASFGLAALANNGGPTQTRLPADSSPAHNDGNPAIVGAPPTDQRGAGFARIVQTIDIGAVEIQAPGLAATGFVLNPWVPVSGVLLLLLGVGAVLYTRKRQEGSHRA